MNKDLITKTLFGLVNICLFRAKPSVLPYSIFMLAILIIIRFSLDVIEWNRVLDLPALKDMAQQTHIQIVIATFFSLAIYIMSIYVLLYRKNYVNRLNKVLIALFGTQLLISALSQSLMRIFSEDFFRPLLILLIFWNFLIGAAILKEALDIKMLKAVLIIILITFLSQIPTSLILHEQLQSLLQLS